MTTANPSDTLGISILKDVVLFDYIVGGSTGEKTVDADDFIREVGKMLPSGSFAWVSKYRSEAKREILKVGVSRRVNNRVRGYFVPTQHAQDLAVVLNNIKAKYFAEKTVFLDSLAAKVEEWASSSVNSGTTQGGKSRADLIRQHAPQRAVLEKLLTFDTSAIRISDTSYFGESDALQTEVKGLVGQAAVEIAEDVNRSWSRKNTGKTTSRILGLVRRVQDKAEAMSVLSSKFDNLAKMCASVLSVVPSGQSIEGVAFIQVSGLLSFCMDPEKILGVQSTEFDPLDVDAASVLPGVTDANILISSQDSMLSQDQSENEDVSVVAETSIVPPLPTGRDTESNYFLDEVKIQPAVQAETSAKPESNVPSDVGTFVF